jgi:hypothetical protein
MPRPEVKPQVKRHLEKNNVDPDDLPDGVIEALNACSAPELQLMDNVGASMEAANLKPELVLFSVH